MLQLLLVHALRLLRCCSAVVSALLLYPGDGHVGRDSVEIDGLHAAASPLRSSSLDEHELGCQHFLRDPRTVRVDHGVHLARLHQRSSAIRSLTASPASFRIRCTRLTSSRASPSRLQLRRHRRIDRREEPARPPAPPARPTPGERSSGRPAPSSCDCPVDRHDQRLAALEAHAACSLVNAATACAASGVCFPNFLPSERKFGFASSVTSASPRRRELDLLDVELRREQRQRAAPSAASSTFGATQTIRDSGCRTLIPTSSRAARPSGRACGSLDIARVERRHRPARCVPRRTARGAPTLPSARDESSRSRTARTARAAGTPTPAPRAASRTPRGCPPRRRRRTAPRLSRTYQFARSSSTNSMIARAAAVASYVAERRVDRLLEPSRAALSIHRSISGRSASGGSCSDGDQPKFAYCAKMPL